MLTSSVTASSAFVNASAAAGHVLRRSFDIGVRVLNRVANAATSSAAHRTVVCRHRWRAYRPKLRTYPRSTSVAFRSVSSSVSSADTLSWHCLFATLWRSSHRTRFSQYACRLVVSGSGCGRSRPCDMPVSRSRHRYHRTRQNDWHRRRRWLQQVGWTENTSTSLFNDKILYFFLIL